jgi:exonuclease III
MSTEHDSASQSLNDVLIDQCDDDQCDDVLIDQCDELDNDEDAQTVSDASPWDGLRHFRDDHTRQLILGSLNINSLRYKFPCVKFILESAFIDCFSIIESKLDDTFTDTQFHVKGFNMYRQDSTATSGGIVTWLRNDIANCRRHDLEILNTNIQCLCVEINVSKEKWFILSVYRLPNADVRLFIECLTVILDKMFLESKMILVMGDININMLSGDNRAQQMNDVLDMYNMKNIIKSATCFKGENSTLIDVVLVSNSHRFSGWLNYTCGLSDYHNFIACSTKRNVNLEFCNTEAIKSFVKQNLMKM